MKKKYSVQLLLIVVFACIGFFANAQSISINAMTPASHPLTLPQTSTITTNNGNGAVTFIIKNTNPYPAILDTVSYFIQGAGTQQTTLWYSATSLSGPTTAALPAWTQIATANVNAPLANTMQPLLTNLNFIIPGNTTYRFQLIRSGLGYGGTGNCAAPNSPTPDSLTNSGVLLGVGNYKVGGTVCPTNTVGFGQATMAFVPRYFVGEVSLFLQSTACAGMPNHDTVVGNATPCPGVSTCYSLTGNNPNSGLSYQWFQSTTSATGPWMPTSLNDTNSFFCTIPPQPGPTWYMCVTTCDTSMLSDTATAIMVTPATFSPFSPCYCGNSFATINNLGDLGQFSVGTLINPALAPPQQNNPGTPSAYSNFDTLTPVPTFIQGQTYPVSMMATFFQTFQYNGWVKAWIDYDHNTAWTSPPAFQEEILNSSVVAPGFDASAMFTVPTTAVPGLTRLRVVYNMLGNQAGTIPCGPYNRGETEDYVVNILAAGPSDPAVTNIQALPAAGCLDSCENVIVTISNFGSQVLDLSITPVVVSLNVDGPLGLTTYVDTLSAGSLQPFNTNSTFLLFPCVNFYEGGTYTINTDTLTVLNASAVLNNGNTNLVNDSLFAAITVHNSRPNAVDYNLCINDTIPTGQGLGIINCPTAYVQDSVLIPLTIGFAGNTPPAPTSCSALGAGAFATGTLPTLPPGANMLSGEISVSNLQLAPLTFTTGPNLTRMSLYDGNVTLPTVPANVYHNGAIGNTLGAWAFGCFPGTPATNPSFLSIAPGVDLNQMYNNGVPVPAGGLVGVGHWSTNRCTATNILTNCGGTTVATLKIVYEYVPMGISWYEQPSGGVRISDSSVLNPLLTTNGIVSNSSTASTYTFYGACQADTNCRVEVDLIIQGITIDSVSWTNVLCNGDSSGTAYIHGVGGNTGLYYTLGSDTNSTGIFTNLPSGVYSINVHDSTGCSGSDSVFTITEPTALVIDSIVGVSPGCAPNTNTGSLTVYASGGTGALPYDSMTASGVATIVSNNVFSNLTGGTYLVTVYDANGCSDTMSQTLVAPTAPTWSSASSTDALCAGDTSGTITVSATAGSNPNVWYTRTPPVPAVVSTSGVFTGVGAGPHTVRAIDSNNCFVDTSLTINEPPTLYFATSMITHISCNGDSTGSIIVTAGGGTPGYQYSIPPAMPSASGTFTNLPAGPTTIRITDSNGCTHDTTINISEPAALVISGIATDVLCYGDSTGSIAMSHTGGTGVVNYQPNPLTGLVAGTYTITGTDVNGCTATTTVTIGQPASAVQITNITSTTPTCVPGCDAVVTILATGGTTPAYQYQYGATGPQVSNTFSNQCAGTQLATVTDANGCTDTMTHTISVPGSPTWGAITIDSVDCNGGSDGSFTVNVNLGTTATSIDTIEVTAPAANAGVLSMNSTTGSLTGLPAGMYTVRAVDANGCAIITTVVVAEPAALAFGAITIDSVDCNGGSDGSVTVTVTGGNGSNAYAINSIPAQNNSTGIFPNLPAGPYAVMITDAKGCTISTSVTIAEPLALSYTNVSVTNVSCNGAGDGQIVATGAGGTAPITIGLPTPGVPSPATFSNLSGSPYTIRITDTNGCTLDSVVQVLEPAVLTIDTSSVTQVLCHGDSTAVVVMTHAGGTAPITYSTPYAGATIVDSTISNLPAGTYTITGTDANGCMATYSVTITEPATSVMITAITGTTPSCVPGNDGTITITASGGNGPLVTYLTSNPSQTYPVVPPGVITGLGSVTGAIVMVEDVNGCTADTTYSLANSSAPTIDSTTTVMTQCHGDSTGSLIIYGTGNPQLSVTYQIVAPPPFVTIPQSSGSFTNLPANFYTVEVNDANNCPVQVTVQITEPTAVNFASVTTDSVSCNGGNDGSILVTASGGTAPYTAAGATISASPNFTYNNLSAGPNFVQITDANACTIDSAFTIYEPSAVVVDTSWSTDVLCNGDSTGTLTVQSSGGTGPITYSINTTPVQTNTTGVFTGLAAMSYAVTATDVNGCFVVTNFTVNQPSAVVASFTSSNVSCNGGNDGQIVLSGTGGVGNYDYALQPPFPVFSPNTTFTPLGAATNYIGIVRDSNGCIDSTGMIAITEPTAVVFNSVTKQDIDCFGQSTGSISASASGGTGHVFIEIPGVIPQQSPATFLNLPAGTYTITARDANQCTTTTSITIIENPQLLFSSITNTEERCHGDGDASITFQGAGGVGPYTYRFNNGLPPGTMIFNTQTTYTGLATGTYQIEIRDALGCVRDTFYTLSGPDRINFPVFIVTPTTCLDTEDGKLTVEAAGGRGGRYTYSLEPGFYVNTTGLFRELPPRQYTLRTTDTAGCFIDTTVDVPLPSNPMIVSVSKEDLGCHGRGNEGKAEALTTGGTPPYTYLWSSTPVQTTSVVDGLYQGLHTVEVVDANGCLVRDTLIIEPGPCCQEVFLPNAFSPNGDGRNDEFRILSTAGIELQQFEVRNRWGERIWQSGTVRNSWNGMVDGEPVDLGTYYYVLRYKCLTDGQNYTVKGDVIVVR